MFDSYDEVVQCIQDLLPNLEIYRTNYKIEITGYYTKFYVYKNEIVAFKGIMGKPSESIKTLFELQDWIITNFDL